MSGTEHLLGYDAYHYWVGAIAAQNDINIYDREECRKLLDLTGFPAKLHDRYVLPPWGIWLYYILGYLPFETARLVWLGMNCCAILLGAAVVYRSFRHRLPDCSISAPIFLVAAVLFPPALASMIWGNHIGFLFLAVALAMLAKNQGRIFLAGACSSLLILKAQLFLPFLAASIISEWKTKDFLWSKGFAVGALAQVLLSYKLAPLSFSSYLPFLISGGLKLHYKYMGISFGQVLFVVSGTNFLRMLWPLCGLLIGSLAGLSKSIGRLFNSDQSLLALGLLAAPYSWSHSMLVLLPSYLRMLFEPPKKILEARLVLIWSCTFAICSLPIILRPEFDYLFFILLIVLLIFCLTLKHETSPYKPTAADRALPDRNVRNP